MKERVGREKILRLVVDMSSLAVEGHEPSLFFTLYPGSSVVPDT